ncbi:monovalent cation/H+ antiporter subunit D [Luteimonas fraxinea]|uniref:Monovalent cation/H+ antiporter subunit D n=1 Tax=Luteimonas fraxinea TaxID=2901869 RepID=A0ABS8UH68_9GAMM|nr:monovalent cation/H+ antiporter subunit D [Luteimonas fraxinea]MCD9098634.1 monovalent cation/H+ antiporter subunit D [Luteimonas fraxinea]MCD9127367.1 monovalent cation/H+ antiporter subunit D [Luteimonas fraxinea]UHH08964.1 monovalent cation/H+ antiporter subunit D [Luteimonas fraxinea]
MNHIAIAPVLVPLVTGAILLLLERTHRASVLRMWAWIGMAALLVTNVALLREVLDGDTVVYLLGDWPARLGIALVVDRLSALMVTTTTLLAIPCLLYACAGWDKRALHFHALFQVQLAGLNGAFLTGDVFNLFVFFEVMLIASYGLLLSGARGARIKAGMHYVVFNIAASTVFLLALGLLYGMLGTLNMAEMAVRVAALGPDQALLVRAGAGLLLLVFCAKAALLPLYLWLPEAYARAPAAVAALFTIMTKVGLYAVLRIYTLVFGSEAGLLADFAWPWLLPAGAATMVLAALGVVGAPRLRIGVAYLVLLSAGTLFVAFSLGNAGAISAGLYYLPQSVFVTAALFLLADIIQRHRGGTGDYLMPIASMPGKTVPALLFLVAAVSVSGLPPLSGFIGKLQLLNSVPEDVIGWVWAAILGSSLMAVIGLSRSGTRLFWRVDPVAEGVEAPPLRRSELAATMLLLGYGIVMTVFAGPILRYTEATAAQLLAPSEMIERVIGETPVLREPSR